MVSQEVVKGHWTEIRGRVKRKWASVTDDDLLRAEGDLEVLVGIVQQRTGEPRQEIEDTIEEIAVESSTAYERTLANMKDQAHVVQEQADRARQATAEQMHHAQQLAAERYEEARQALEHTYDEVQESIRQRPWETMAVAAGTGLIAGVMIGLIFRPSR